LARKLSREALADAAALHTTHISLIEQGQRSVRLETIERLALALRAQLAELMPAIDLPLGLAADAEPAVLQIHVFDQQVCQFT
jgi:transcriptional regulator with XRE-family HTH domain